MWCTGLGLLTLQSQITLWEDWSMVWTFQKCPDFEALHLQLLFTKMKNEGFLLLNIPWRLVILLWWVLTRVFLWQHAWCSWCDEILLKTNWIKNRFWTLSTRVSKKVLHPRWLYASPNVICQVHYGEDLNAIKLLSSDVTGQIFQNTVFKVCLQLSTVKGTSVKWNPHVKH